MLFALMGEKTDIISTKRSYLKIEKSIFRPFSFL